MRAVAFRPVGAAVAVRATGLGLARSGARCVGAT